MQINTLSLGCVPCFGDFCTAPSLSVKSTVGQIGSSYRDLCSCWAFYFISYLIQTIWNSALKRDFAIKPSANGRVFQDSSTALHVIWNKRLGKSLTKNRRLPLHFFAGPSLNCFPTNLLLLPPNERPPTPNHHLQLLFKPSWTLFTVMVPGTLKPQHFVSFCPIR